MSPLAKSVASATLAVSIALGSITASATPARANNDEIAAVLGGIVALYVIGKALQGRQSDVAVSRSGTHRPHTHAPRPRHQPLVAPARCFVDGRDAGGYYRGYVRRCMQNNVARPDALPQQCLRRVETSRGPRMIYAGRCLFQNGWQREAGFRP